MKLVCSGLVRPNQMQVHGCALSLGWVTVMIQDVLSKGKVEPWKEYPTHSGEVEEGSFVDGSRLISDLIKASQNQTFQRRMF